MAVQIRPMELAALVELINGWGSTPRRLGQRDAPPTSVAPALEAQVGPVELATVADQLHPVFATEGSIGRARLVNTLLADTAVRPRLEENDGILTAAWSVAKARDALLASAALALREHLVAHRDRLGVCADRQCADVYVDASPGGHRRFCSLTCQNRARAAAFRQRRREAGYPGA